MLGATRRIDPGVREELRDAVVIGRDARRAEQQPPRFTAIARGEIELRDREQDVHVVAVLFERVLRGLRERVRLHGAGLRVLREGRQQIERIG